MEESCTLQGIYLQIHSSMSIYQLAFRTINTLDHLLSNLWPFWDCAKYPVLATGGMVQSELRWYGILTIGGMADMEITTTRGSTLLYGEY